MAEEKEEEEGQRKKKKAKVGEEADGGGEGVRQKGEVQFNATSEFFRVLGELPTYGQSGNRDSDEEDQLDFEKEAEAEKKIEEGIATGVSTGEGREKRFCNARMLARVLECGGDVVINCCWRPEQNTLHSS